MQRGTRFSSCGARSGKRTRQGGFLALEAVVALAIACIALTTTVQICSQIRAIQQAEAYRADNALASYMLKQTKEPTVIVHDHRYHLTKDGDLYDEKTKQICPLK